LLLLPLPAALTPHSFWQLKQHLYRRTLYTWISDAMCDDFVEPMKGMSFEELDELAASFKFENCATRDQMVEVLRGGGAKGDK
jgi:hypothetical protein